MQKITPFLWYDGQAEEATNFYLSVFKNSRLLSMHRVNSGDGNVGVVTSTSFEIDGQQFMALMAALSLSLPRLFLSLLVVKINRK